MSPATTGADANRSAGRAGEDEAMNEGSAHGRRRIVLAALAVVQLALAGAAWTDLARRPGRLVRGPKWIWALVIAVNFIGPLWYFRWGRLPEPEPATPGAPAAPPPVASAVGVPAPLPE
jgi:hypothetical protein